MSSTTITDSPVPDADLSTVFYDVLFKNSLSEIKQLNELEQNTLKLITEIVINPQLISSYIPPFPVVLAELLELIKNENADFRRIGDLHS